MLNKEGRSDGIIRAALYIRVSTDEQAIHGLSLDAQEMALTEWAKKNSVKVVDTYIDSGKTARKSLKNRVELQRLLSDIESDKIDLVLFTKLDRWFRNIKDYYKIQDILENHGVNWKAIFENYDTSTANGRLHINIMLSIAQDEADRTSERIKAVFASKLERGEATTSSLPIGYKLVNSRIIVDEERANIARELFSAYLLTNGQRSAAKVISDTYGVYLHVYTVHRMLTNPMYIGTYRGIENFCEPLISVDDFNRVQEIIKSKNIKSTPSTYDFIFSGMLICSECGCHLSGNHQLRNRAGGIKRSYVTYRCNKFYSTRKCVHNSLINEKKIEEFLISNIRDEIKKFIIDYEMQQKNIKKPKINKAEIRRKIDRLKELYINDLIDMDTYRTDYTALNEKLNMVEPREKRIDIKPLRELLDSDFENTYDKLDNKSKRIFWRGIIDHLEISATNAICIRFTN